MENVSFSLLTAQGQIDVMAAQKKRRGAETAVDGGRPSGHVFEKHDVVVPWILGNHLNLWHRAYTRVDAPSAECVKKDPRAPVHSCPHHWQSRDKIRKP